MTVATEAVADIELLVRSRYGIIHIDSVEDQRVQLVLRHLADRLQLPFFRWTRTRGIFRDGNANAVYETAEPAQALAHVVSAQTAAIYHFKAFQGLESNDLIIQRLREVAAELGRRSGALVITGTGITIPAALRHLVASTQLPAPSDDELRALISHVIKDVGLRREVSVTLTAPEEERMIRSLRGLTLLEVEKVITRAVVEDGVLDPGDLQHVIEARKRLVEQDGVLEYYPAEESMADVAGMAALREWLRRRANILTDPERAEAFGLTFPRGMLLIGVPGCGKSLCARAVASEWKLPLLRMDTAGLYNKFVGETENNFRRAMRTAEAMAPCVLFIDELEKAFAAGGGDDGGVSARVLGTFLTWLQERKAPVFVVATANDVSKLPAEFLRKGRFDETFFVDLPDAVARADIFGIHLRRRRQDPTDFDLPVLATAARGFSGAEIEQVIVSALYAAFAEDVPLTTPHLLREAASTRPLAVMMAERITALREWAAGRTVPAN